MKLERICYWILIFALGVLLLKMQYCSGRKPCPTITEKTVHDTLPPRIDTIPSEHERLVPVYKKRPSIKPEAYVLYFDKDGNIIEGDSTGKAPELLTDTLEMVNDYLDLKGYSQKYESEGDTIIVENEVHRNQLQNQKVITKLKSVVTTKYIIQKDTVEVPFSRNVILFGAGVFGNKTTAGAKANINLLTKKQAMYTLEWVQPFGQKGYISIERKIPIRLTKK